MYSPTPRFRPSFCRMGAYTAVFGVLVQGGSAQEEVLHTGLSDSSTSDQGSSYYVNTRASQFAMSLSQGRSAARADFSFWRVQSSFSQSSFSGSDDLGSDDDMSVSTVQNDASVRLQSLHIMPRLFVSRTAELTNFHEIRRSTTLRKTSNHTL